MVPHSSKSSRKRRGVPDISMGESVGADDIDLEDEDMILHSMDDMMSSIRDGLSQRNQSYHSLCPLGWIHVDEMTCVECPIGTFHNFLERICSPCPFGTYQFKGGQLSCVVCPDHTSTAGENSKSPDDCKPQCVPGMFSKNSGLIPCETCLLPLDIGLKISIECGSSVSSLNAQSNCAVSGRVSTAVRVEILFAMSIWNDNNETSVISASRLQRTLPVSVRLEIRHRPLLSLSAWLPPTARRPKRLHTCEWSKLTTVEILTAQTPHSSNEYLPFNACFSSPCQNEGTCTPMDKHFACTCLPGHTGSYCEKRIDECALFPCGLNATCVLHETSGYTCLCPPSVRGLNCNEDVDECAIGSCLNGATCVNTFGSFQCICPSGYTGPTCAEDVDECGQQPYGQYLRQQPTSLMCHNGGRCINIPGSFRCECLDEFTGKYCEHLLCGCQNGGNCSAGRCFCPAGFWGNKCQHLSSKSFCQEVKPCLNGGTCKDVESDNFVCQCQPGTTGLLCEDDVGEDFVLHFFGNTTSDSVRLSNRLDTKPLKEFSVCLWLKSNDTQNYGTPFSYASEEKDNLITITDYNGLVFYVNNEHVISDITITDNRWHHLCLLWAQQFGQFAIYVNSQLVLEGGNLSTLTSISPNGTLVLGQEQDRQGSGFARMESYAGLITHVYMWGRRLREAEIKFLFSDCASPVRLSVQPNHLLVSWGDFRAGVRGNVKMRESNFCKPCGLPETTGNGYATSNGQNSGARVQWHCDPLFELVGNREAFCLKIGEWSAPKPTCVGKYCPVGQIGNGRTTPPVGLVEVGEIVRFECNDGLFLQGPAVAVCESTTRLNISANPSCNNNRSKPSFFPRRCVTDDVEILKRNLRVVRTSNESSTEESFQCPAGFRLEGAPTRFCLSGEWSAPLAFCHPVVCPPLQAAMPTSVIYSDGTSVGSFANFRCTFGYRPRPEAPKALICNIKGDWQPSFRLEEACEPIECDPLPPIQHALLNRSVSHYVGSVVEIKCARGFSMASSLDARLICLQSGAWSQTPSDVCVVKQCSFLHLPQVDGSSVWLHNASTIFGSVAEISCARGFRSTSGLTRMLYKCQDHGWQRTDVTVHTQARLLECKSIRCPHPRHPPNGRAHFVDRGVGATIEFSCRLGYTLSETASQEIVCQEDGLWSVGIAQLATLCVRNRPCSQLAVPLNGYMNITASQANFSCDKGFQLVGSGILRCVSGQWSDVAPECQPQHCPTESEGGLVVEHGIFVPTRGSIGDRVPVSCKLGHELRGDAEWHCLENATWSGSSACVPVTCAPPEDSFATASYKDYRYGSSINYSCNHGHVLVGSRVRVCLASGQWSSPVPSCRLVSCPPLPDDPSLTIKYDPYNSTLFGNFNVCEAKENELLIYLGTRVAVSCASPSNFLAGASMLFCGEQGTWKPLLPSCLPTSKSYCPPSGPSANGRMDNIGNIYRFKCEHGYRLVGSSEVNCSLEAEPVEFRPPKCTKLTACPMVRKTI
ncbi:sushi [Tropilaelaps mercedesae]|uniref:Sushi n=1 Tax=Tropilaelaps mercedesae TaxID=418985 RepID=A0A1V9XJX9_9ACAR|nr:sushi [Tropilaelaps mercedesae]